MASTRVSKVVRHATALSDRGTAMFEQGSEKNILILKTKGLAKLIL
jgi:hypothetical protein